MIERLSPLFAWIGEHETLLWWLGAFSVVTFIATLIAVPYLVTRIPADYFTRDHSLAHRLHLPHPLLRLIGLIAKNLLGLIVILCGIAMLVLPGQGILTILIGLMLMNFPGKHALELRIVRQPSILRAINWMRAKAKHPPLQIPA